MGKSVWAVFLATILVFSFLTSAPLTHGQDDGPKVTATTTSNLNVRSEPTVNGALLGSLSPDATVEVQERILNEAGELWLLIPFGASEAWIAGWLVEIEGNIDTIGWWSESAVEETSQSALENTNASWLPGVTSDPYESTAFPSELRNIINDELAELVDEAVKAESSQAFFPYFRIGFANTSEYPFDFQRNPYTEAYLRYFSAQLSYWSGLDPTATQPTNSHSFTEWYNLALANYYETMREISITIPVESVEPVTYEFLEDTLVFVTVDDFEALMNTGKPNLSWRVDRGLSFSTWLMIEGEGPEGSDIFLFPQAVNYRSSDTSPTAISGRTTWSAADDISGVFLFASPDEYDYWPIHENLYYPKDSISIFRSLFSPSYPEPPLCGPFSTDLGDIGIDWEYADAYAQCAESTD